MPRLVKKMSTECINYVHSCQRRWVKPDPDARFAENCIQQLYTLNIASSAGFYDECGRAWTLSKRCINEGIEIFVKCVEAEGDGKKNVVKFAWIYPASQILGGGNSEKSVPVSIGEWVVQVAF